MEEFRSLDLRPEEERCYYHAQASRAGECGSCKAGFCASCAVAYPGQQHATLCLDCGTALFIKVWRRALVFALLGALLGLCVPLRLHFSQKFVWLITGVSGYLGWAFYYGWHYGNERWKWSYARLRKNFKSPASCLALVAIMRCASALFVGACGGGLRLCLRMLHLLRKQRSLVQAYQEPPIQAN